MCCAQMILYPFSVKCRTSSIVSLLVRQATIITSQLFCANSFKDAYIELSKNIDDSEIIVQGLADAFNAPKTAVRIRLREVLYV